MKMEPKNQLSRVQYMTPKIISFNIFHFVTTNVRYFVSFVKFLDYNEDNFLTHFIYIKGIVVNSLSECKVFKINS